MSPLAWALAAWAVATAGTATWYARAFARTARGAPPSGSRHRR
ncbi:hypothetical protein ACI79C_07555 [Geodermatophilus sp. SYSU D00697]